MHFLSMCPLYKQNREILYRVAAKESKHFPNLSYRNKFIWLVCNESKDICLQLAPYVSRSESSEKSLYESNIWLK